jgi:hypothetical protein
LAWAAPQDWMLIAEHHRRTVDNYVELRDPALLVPK